MPTVIYTNQASLMAQKGLLGSQNAVANSVERLSSGLRINRAKDDAAGLGIGESLQKQLNGVSQGLHNVNDAISMAQTAEGALSTVSSITQRMLMLATQGANDTLSKEQRNAIGQEIIKLRTAVNDISKRTKYTDTQLFNGAEKKIQVSSLSNDTINLSANDFKKIEITGISLTPLATATAPVTMKLFLASGGTLNGATIDSQNNSITVNAGASITGTVKLTSNNTRSGGDVVPVISEPSWGDRTSSFSTISSWVGTGNQSLNATINLTAPSTPGYYRIYFAAGAELSSAQVASSTNWETNGGQPVWNDGNDVVDLNSFDISSALTNGYVVIPNYTLPAGSSPVAIGLTYIDVKVPDANGNVPAVSSGGAPLIGSDLSSKIDAIATAISNGQSLTSTNFTDLQASASTYLNNITTMRGNIGAVQNQLEYTVSNLTEFSNNLSASRSRVMDADYAMETANLTKGQILQQASTAMLAQANQFPSMILSLLKDGVK